ncbi:hypothetical protein H9P43_006599 [Blastocladiella emersonii ATCC 22665]|nr:hypothetical protein H9P43_006599 [Blastocladiella emersonii ATCC 22665]
MAPVLAADSLALASARGPAALAEVFPSTSAIRGICTKELLCPSSFACLPLSTPALASREIYVAHLPAAYSALEPASTAYRAAVESNTSNVTATDLGLCLDFPTALTLSQQPAAALPAAIADAPATRDAGPSTVGAPPVFQNPWTYFLLGLISLTVLGPPLALRAYRRLRRRSELAALPPNVVSVVERGHGLEPGSPQMLDAFVCEVGWDELPRYEADEIPSVKVEIEVGRLAPWNVATD